MQRILPCALLCAASLSAATPAFAWMTEPARNPDNGHYYAFFNGADGDRLSRPAMPFATALSRAASMSHFGVPGHLATITSQAEQDFILQVFKELRNSQFTIFNENFWIAGSDAAVEGEWRWVAGPEAGQLFWQGKADGLALDYQSWLTRTNGSTREPNNSPSYFNRDGEDYLALIFQESERLPSYWNDVVGFEDNSRSSPRFGLVEFSVIPEPSSAALIASAGLMLVAACRRRAWARR